MTWFRKLRNDHTHGVTFSAGGMHETTHTAPRPCTTAVHNILPLKADLEPRVDNLHNTLMQVARAEEYVANCERPIEHHPGPLQASTDGRCKRFCKSAANKMGAVVGIGRGEVPMVRRPWERAGAPKPEPIEVLDGTSKYRKFLHLEPKQTRLARQTITALAGEQIEALHSASKTEYRRAQDKHAATSSRLSHAQTVSSWLTEHTQLAREKHDENLNANITQHDAHEKMQLRLRQIEERLETLSELSTQSTQQLQELSDKKAITEKKITLLEQRREATLSALQAANAYPNTPELERNLAARQELLGDITQTHQRLQRRLQTQARCQKRLATAKHDKHHSMLLSATWLNAKRAATQYRERLQGMEQPIRQIKNHQADLHERLNQLNNVVTRLQKDRQLNTQRTNLENALLDAQLELGNLTEPQQTLQQAHQAQEQERQALKTQHATLSEQALEFRKIQIVGAQNRAEKSRMHLQELNQRLERQKNATAALVPAHHEAQVRFEQEKTNNQLRLKNNLENSVHTPPGFDPVELNTPQGKLLVQHLSTLATRLQAPPIGKTQEQHERGWRMPGEQALAVVVKAISLHSKGNAALAAAAAQGLVERGFADLVPHSNTDFNGHDMRIDHLSAEQPNPLKAVAQLIAARPHGMDILERVSAPQPQAASETLKNAVMVYYKATTALSQAPPGDAPSLIWLQNAEEAAKCVAHPTEPGSTPESTYTALEPLARQTFNGVRMGLTSVAPGSPHHEANQWLHKLGELFIEENLNARFKANPLKARKMAVKGAAEVGLPSPENICSRHLKAVCDGLLNITGVEKNITRERALLSHETGPHLTEAVIRTRYLLCYIRDQYNQGRRIDNLKLDAKAWKKINKSTAHSMAKEASPKKRSPALSEITQSLNRTGGSAGPGLPMEWRLDIADLEDEIEAMQTQDLSALEILERLHQHFVVNPSASNSMHSDSDKDSANPMPPLTLPASHDPIEQAHQSVQFNLAPLETQSEPEQNHRKPFTSITNTSPTLSAPNPSENPRPMAPDSPVPIPSASSSDPDPGIAPPDFTVPKHPITVALQAAQKSAEQSQKFIENCSPEDFADWITQTVGNVFGIINISQGHTAGLSTGGATGLLTKLTTMFGVMARPIADLTKSKKQQLTVQRTARGLTLVLNNEKGHQWNLGLNGGPAFKIPGVPLSAGLIGSLTHGKKTTQAQGGLVMRSPRAGPVAHPQAIREFGEMLHTALTWKKITNEAGQPQYAQPIDALLDLHPRVSLGSIDHLNTQTYTAASGVSGFAAVGGATSGSGPGAGIAAGIGTRRQTEKISYSVTAGAQPYTTHQTTNAGTTGLTGSVGLRVVGEVGPHAQGTGDADKATSQLASATATLNIHTTSAKSNVSVIGWPDGSMIGERQLEFNNFEEFAALVPAHREAWIHTMMKKFEFPDTFTASDQRILCERKLDEFLTLSKQNMDSGVLILREWLDVKPHVGAQLGGYKALEELARLEVQQLQTDPQALSNAVAQAKLQAAAAGQIYIDPITAATAQAVAMQGEQEKLLNDAASFQPFLLTSAGRSIQGKSWGLNFLAVMKKDTAVLAGLTHDRFPDANPNKGGYTKAQPKRNS